MKPIILYKIHENSDCAKFLDIVRYLYTIGYDIRPLNIIERNIPSHIINLPSIEFNNIIINGLNNIIKFYERILKIDNLMEKTENFILLNPNYRISDNSTH